MPSSARVLPIRDRSADFSSASDLPCGTVSVRNERTEAARGARERVPGFVRRLPEIARFEGVAGLVGRPLARLGVRVYCWLCIDTDAEIERPAVPPGCALEELEPTATDEYLAFRRRSTAARFQGRLRDGHRCFAVRHGPDLIAVTWLSSGRTRAQALRRDLVPGAGEAYNFDSYVHPSWRGRRLDRLLASLLTTVARDEGYRQLGCLIAFYNRSSRRCRLRCGFRQEAVVVALDLGPIHLLHCFGAFRGRLMRSPAGAGARRAGHRSDPSDGSRCRS